MSFFDNLLNNLTSSGGIASISDAVNGGDYGGLFDSLAGAALSNTAGAVPAPTTAAVAHPPSQGNIATSGAYPNITQTTPMPMSPLTKNMLIGGGVILAGVALYFLVK